MKKCARCHALYAPRLIRCPECAKRELAEEVATASAKVPPKAWIRVKKRKGARKDPDVQPTRELFEQQLREDATVEVRKDDLRRLRKGVEANARTESTSPWYGAPLTDNSPTPSRLPAVMKKTVPAARVVRRIEEGSDEFELAMESFHEWSEGLEQSTGAAPHASSSDVFVVAGAPLPPAESRELAPDSAPETDDALAKAAGPRADIALPPRHVAQPGHARNGAAPLTVSAPMTAEELRTHIFRQRDPEPPAKPSPPKKAKRAFAAARSVGEPHDEPFDWSFEDEPEPTAFSREERSVARRRRRPASGPAAWSGRITSFVLFFTAGAAYAAHTSVRTFAALLAAAGIAAVLSVARRPGMGTVVAVGAMCGVFVAWLHTLGVTAVTWGTLDLPMWHGGTLATLPLLGVWLILSVAEASTSGSEGEGPS